MWHTLLTSIQRPVSEQPSINSVAAVGFNDASTLLYAIVHCSFAGRAFNDLRVVSCEGKQRVIQDFDRFLRYYAPKELLAAMSRDNNIIGKNVAKYVISNEV